jgi:hypothetical protein
MRGELNRIKKKPFSLKNGFSIFNFQLFVLTGSGSVILSDVHFKRFTTIHIGYTPDP